ncbi:hypothetical protein ACR6C2_40165 [Streptomyces sp. INA 01156]
MSYPDTGDRPNPALELLPDILDASLDEGARHRTVDAALRVLGPLLPDFADTTWWHDDWIQDRVRTVPERFDRAFDRWRQLFRAALDDQYIQNKRRLDYSLTETDRNRATARRREAETQLNLLRNESIDSKSVLSDFNPTATSPPRASCPATASRACRWPRTSRRSAAAAARATTSSGPASSPSGSSGPARSSTTRAPVTR